MSRTRRFVAAITAGYINQILIMLAGFWLTPFLLNHLGKRDYGLWLISLQIITYLGLAEFGSIALLPRDLARLTTNASNTETYQNVRVHLEGVSASILLQTILVATLAGLAWLLLPKEWGALKKPIGITMLAFAALFPFRILQATLEGLQLQAQVSAIATVGWLFGLGINITMVVHGLGLLGVAFGWVSYQAILVLGCGLYLARTCPAVFPRKVQWNGWRTVLNRWNRGYWLSLQQVAQILLNGTDLLIIGRMLGPSVTVPYSCTGKLASVLSNQPGLLMQTAMPGLSQLRALENTERLRQVGKSLTTAMMILSGACAAVIIGTNKYFVAVWVGSQMYSGFGLTALMLALLMVRHLNLTFASMSFSFGHERRMCIFALLEGAFGFSLSLLLTPYIGVYGVVVGPLISLCLTSLVSNLLTVSRELHQTPLTALLSLWTWFWRFGIAVIAALVAGNYWHPSTLLQVTLLASSITAFYAVLMTPVVLKSELRGYAMTLASGIRRRLTPALEPAIVNHLQGDPRK